MPGRTNNRHSPSTRCRCARRPTSSQPIQASRACRRSAHDANPTPPRQPCAGVHQIPQLRAHKRDRRRAGARAPSSVFQTRRCASVSTSTSVRSRNASRPCRARPRPAPPGAPAHAAHGAHRRRRAPTSRQQDVAGRLQVGQRRAATRALQPARAHHGNRTLHRRGRRPARDCQRLARPPRSPRRAVGRDCPRRLRPT